MLARFGRIRSEFGTGTAVRVAVLLIGLPLLAVLGVAGFATWWPAAAAAAGLAAGALLRRAIVNGVDHCDYDAVIRVGLVVYAVVLVAGGRMGLSPEARLVVVTVTTVVIFDIRFWSLSDPLVRNAERRSGP